MCYGAFYACILVLLINMTIERPALYPVLAGRLLYIMLFTKAVFYLPSTILRISLVTRAQPRIQTAAPVPLIGASGRGLNPDVYL